MHASPNRCECNDQHVCDQLHSNVASDECAQAGCEFHTKSIVKVWWSRKFIVKTSCDGHQRSIPKRCDHEESIPKRCGHKESFSKRCDYEELFLRRCDSAPLEVALRVRVLCCFSVCVRVSRSWNAGVKEMVKMSDPDQVLECGCDVETQV